VNLDEMDGNVHVGTPWQPACQKLRGSVKRAVERARAPFPRPVRTLDALHLASLHYLHSERAQKISLATYDDRLQAAALALGIDIHDLGCRSIDG
jgi:hypothetical protein